MIEYFGEFEEQAKNLVDGFYIKKGYLLARLGEIYRDEVVNQITVTGAVDTGWMRGRFYVEKMDKDSVMVGTNVEYAKYVNDGHKQHKRFVPGKWLPNKTFQYIKGYKSGMMLTERWVDGRKFMEKALSASNDELKREIEDWMNKIGEEANR